MSTLDGIIDSVDMGLSKFWETVKNREAGVLIESNMTEQSKCLRVINSTQRAFLHNHNQN